MTTAWGGDLLGHREIGETFTRLIQSIDPATEQSSKVISIEAGFGWGKTFFRERWAQHLADQGEVVIQIDAQKSDHSGDPVVTFLGALIAALPEGRRGVWTKALGTGKKALWGTAKIAASIAARKAGEEAADALEDWFAGDEDGPLEDALKAFAEHASKGLGQQVVAQIAAEHARQKEIPEQLEALRNALTEDKPASRVVILIDELDRCHPDYVIALLEAMKLVFGEPGFVFVLMVNADQLQALAEHRFGAGGAGERYLSKFVDVCLRLGPTPQRIRQATGRKVGEVLQRRGVELREVQSSVGVAEEIVNDSSLSPRQIEKAVQRLDLAIALAAKEDLQYPLLTFLAFVEERHVTITEGLMWGPRPVVPEAVFHGQWARAALTSFRNTHGRVRMSRGGVYVRIAANSSEVLFFRSADGKDAEGKVARLPYHVVEELIEGGVVDKHISLMRMLPFAD